ncbi:hypothetical protein BP6252_13447 [Coleophoma cylindrospora]|uniref:Uncharacterized protein n=1 Tax=Coleophoma cylindrospora TaxID=1849047 RepID=A0A3D8Q886_9HELO|nr:hypothetical protein BP6252_13447 [Coleophoma cylindrospora]
MDMTNFTSDQAQQHVRSISASLSLPSKDNINKLSLESQQERENLRKQTEAATNVSVRIHSPDVSAVAKFFTLFSIARQLWSNNTHFINELIRNADNCRYSHEETPRISFHIYPKWMAVQYNEDGFSAEDVTALCSTGLSNGDTQPVGKRSRMCGIGFKSVFTAASTVHVKSGPFGFYFEYDARTTNSSLGMINPKWMDSSLEIDHPSTRITLNFRPPTEQVIRNIASLQLPPEILLFLKKLREVTVNKYGSNLQLLSSIKYIRMPIETANRKVLGATSATDGQNTSLSYGQYHVVKRYLTSLPKHHTKPNGNGKVILAFPLDSAGAPIIQTQLVYSYLPLRDYGFKFLIHSAFVVQPNHRDVVHTERNFAILDGIADTFRDAVVQFYHDSEPDLCFKWIHYLPNDSTVTDAFWQQLRPKIKDHLGEVPCLWPRSKKKLMKPTDLLILPPEFQDRVGNPLFPGKNGKDFIAPEYNITFDSSGYWTAVLGVQTMSIAHELLFLRANVKSSMSRLKTIPPEGDWHVRVAAYFCVHLQNSEKLVSIMRHIPLIPLTNGTWASAVGGPIYFPCLDDFTLPAYYAPRIVERSACKSACRKEMFRLLGVRESTEIYLQDQEMVEEDIQEAGSDDYNLSDSSISTKLQHVSVSDAGTDEDDSEE